MTLDDARREIDSIDEQIFELFANRMKITDDIGREKFKKGISIFSPEREKSILKTAEKAVPPEYSQYCTSLYQQLLTLSRDRQRNIFIQENGEYWKLYHTLGEPHREIPSPRIAVQGVPGAYSSIAALRMYPSGSLKYCRKWEDVLCCIQDGTADYGILPAENSSAGTVTEVFDLLLKYKYNVVKAYQLPVDHCLLGVRGSKMQDIKDVFSHPHAFPQCSAFLEQQYRLNRIPSPNTAMAAEFIAKTGDSTKAAIASKECAHIYGLDILAESIQDADDNRTRFVCVSKRLEVHENASKISIVFSLPHVIGSLYRTLARFSLNGHNLTQIVSRPDTSKPFEYYFYVDFSGSISAPNTMNLLGALNEELPNFYFLGCYDED